MKSYRLSMCRSQEKIKIIRTLRAGHADLAVQNSFKRKKNWNVFWQLQSKQRRKAISWLEIVFSRLWQKCSKTPRRIAECQGPVMHV